MYFLQAAFLKTINMSVTGTFMVLAVLAIRALLFRAPRRYSYFLWGIVLLRLLCPISLPSVFSVLNLADAAVSGSGELSYVSTDIVSDHPTGALLPMAPNENAADALSAQKNDQAVPSIFGQPLFALSMVWLSGILVLSGYSFLSVIKLRRNIQCSMQLQGNVYLADQIATPFVFGLFCPKIYLPSSLPDDEREYVILHEKCHIRRKDYLIKIAAFFALCLHWMNPFAWLAFVLAGRDMEISCDEAVLRAVGRDIREEYAASLLKLSAGNSKIWGMPPAFGAGDVKSRIYHVMRYKKQTSAAALALIACALGTICLATNPKSGENSADVPETEENQAF